MTKLCCDLHGRNCQVTQVAVQAAHGTILAAAAKVRLGAYENVLRLLTLPHADHPDYRPGWTP